MTFLLQHLDNIILALLIIFSAIALYRLIERNDEEMRQFIYKLFKGEDEP